MGEKMAKTEGPVPVPAQSPWNVPSQYDYGSGVGTKFASGPDGGWYAIPANQWDVYQNGNLDWTKAMTSAQYRDYMANALAPSQSSFTEDFNNLQNLLSQANYVRDSQMKQTDWYNDPMWQLVAGRPGMLQVGELLARDDSHPENPAYDPVLALQNKYGTADREAYAAQQGFAPLPTDAEGLKAYLANARATLDPSQAPAFFNLPESQIREYEDNNKLAALQNQALGLQGQLQEIAGSGSSSLAAQGRVARVANPTQAQLQQYLANYPDVLQAYNDYGMNLGYNDPVAFALMHYNTNGANEGRSLDPIGGNDSTGAPTLFSGAQGGAQENPT